MIIRTIATALAQCIARTHAGWMTLSTASPVWASVAERLDMIVSLAVSSLLDRYSLYAVGPDSVTAMQGIRPIGAGHAFKKPTPGSPARGRASRTIRVLLRGRIGRPSAVNMDRLIYNEKPTGPESGPERPSSIYVQRVANRFKRWAIFHSGAVARNDISPFRAYISALTGRLWNHGETERI